MGPANCDIACQVTRGAAPKFSDDGYAQWVKRLMAENGYAEKKQLAAALRDASGGRLGDAGANRLVQRATSGQNISALNRGLISEVLGAPDPADVEAQLRDLVERGEALEALAERLPKLLADARAALGEE
jgi:hypothetical protein